MSEVELTEGQSAEPHKCGSCKFFERSNRPEVRDIRGGPSIEQVEIWGGLCGWRPPPWLDRATVHYETNELGEQFKRPREVLDTDTCDLYRTSRATFVQKRRWRVPQDTFGA